MKGFGGPGGSRTPDLFHAMEEASTQAKDLQTAVLKT